ncbi:ABC transporter ATP-binding protein [Ottowia sp.]|mgnify:CR=1 FL=1|uniref:ABC transporter ATP-binding protein n=1 Tax=Ottowia sp. TaxID=1898956 RepID=UPI002B87F823|nr:ABC transporter ATP-binding protein [Ottowia sp.]HRN75049.1 ABC transporter ATP-binding protein [Ottowia sp.]HRQ02153.1 ABC transporter ATP-binding protein [Ottowia sp.]
MALLQVSDLRVDIHTHRGSAPAVRDMAFTLERGDTLGLIGESGCGKSMTALALMGLAPENATVSGSLKLDGRQLIGLRDRDWRAIRGFRIAMIFQEPMTALNPVHRVGAQIAEPLMLHQRLSPRAAREKVTSLLERVGIPNPGQRIDSFPHQFSGGQRQRIMIAMALACEPDVLIADEPTTALDATVQQQILALINELVRERGMALILISHDLGLIAQNVRHMLVMYGGSVVESGRANEVFGHAAHPYTRGLLAARPSLGHRLVAHRSERLPTIPGSVPDLFGLPTGCPFAGRCPFTEDACYPTEPPVVRLSDTHWFRCRRAEVVLRAARSTESPA